MVIAVFFRFDHIHQQAGQIQGVGGRADLVTHHPQGIVFLAQSEHGFDKILSVFAKDPGDTDDEEFLQGVRHRLFALQFGLTIDIQRLVILAVGLPGHLALTVEDVVGGDIDHFAAQLFTDVCNVLSANSINCADFLDLVVVFCQIHSGPGSTMDHHIGASLCDGRIYGCGIGNIHGGIGHGTDSRAVLDAAVLGCNVAAYTRITAPCQLIHDVMAQLACHTGNKYFHRIAPFNR